MTTKSQPARPFTQSSWDGMAGATRFSNGDDPVERGIDNEAGSWYIVADSTCVCFYHYASDDNWEGSEAYLDIQFPNQAAALAFLNGIPEDFTAETYGLKLENY